MEVTKVDVEMESHNCSCGLCKCGQGECMHEEHQNEEWKRKQWEFGDMDEGDQWEGVRKVRCDQDDVNGVKLFSDQELEKWLEPLVIDEKPDLPANENCSDEKKSENGEFVDESMASEALVDGGMGMLDAVRIDDNIGESVDAETAASAAVDGSGGTCIDKSVGDLVVEAWRDMRQQIHGYVDNSADTLVITSSAPIDAKRDAWVAMFCTPPAPVYFEDLGIDRENLPDWETVIEIAHAEERKRLGEIDVTPPELTKTELLQFYAANHCRYTGDICAFCASEYRQRAREQLRRSFELKAARKISFEVGEGGCDESDGGWIEEMI